MTTSTARRGLIITVDGEDRLVGSRCEGCGTHTFPAQLGCPHCGAETTEVGLATSGTVGSWTVQHIRPKPPFQGAEQFEPFAVGYVDLGPLKIETLLTGKPVGDWQIGQPVRLLTGEADAGGEIWNYSFVDTGAGAAS
jgi:uncharacterized OB-fold protein